MKEEYKQCPKCTFDNFKCFARREGKCIILTATPKPRKDGSCPFYKSKAKVNDLEWE